ncbi:MAG: hypothetical protein D6790_08930, partial [Caldilineae bacterium]
MATKQVRYAAILVAILALVLSACAPPPPPSTGGEGAAAPETAGEEAGPVTLTWAMWGSPAEIETHQKVADA